MTETGASNKIQLAIRIAGGGMLFLGLYVAYGALGAIFSTLGHLFHRQWRDAIFNLTIVLILYSLVAFIFIRAGWRSARRPAEGNLRLLLLAFFLFLCLILIVIDERYFSGQMRQTATQSSRVNPHALGALGYFLAMFISSVLYAGCSCVRC